ncbi:HD-GYP domain-containing protein [Aeoliella mucimassa]|uniref:HD-GYP domain-containing protein n=1 Tax=Aeoliella mucimassa TaxID=2527972 RepID=UPI0018D4B377|nr:HD-GYP domain-containing protein [Aeoliella mucimassa]
MALVTHMYVAPCNQVDDSVCVVRQQMLVSLLDTFDTDFRLVASTDLDDWRYLATDELVVINDAQVEPEVSAICESILQSQEPVVTPSTIGDGWLVAIPLPNDVGGMQVAVASIEGQDPEMLRRLAKLWCSSRQYQHQVDKYAQECEQLTEILSEGLEELTFLRSMVAFLDMSDHTHDLTSLAESTFPLLNDNMHADCLALLLTPEGLGPLRAVPALVWGPKPVDGHLLSRVVELFGQSYCDQPVVKNHIHRLPEASELNGVRDFILTPIKSGSTHYGWMLAANRQLPEGFDPSSDWELSHYEFGTSEASLLCTTVSILATHASNCDLFQEKEQMLVNVVRSLVSALDAKDQYTCGHSERVALYAKVLAERVGYDEEACERIYMTGLLHDVGKIGVSDAVLKKPGRLTDEEFAEIKRHPDEGWSILQDLAQLKYVLPGVLHHHEEVDGSGYPDGLSGDKIPLDGRILAIVDAWDAMTSDRPYRNGMPTQKALSILEEGAGSQWDSQLVQAFLEVIDRIELIRNTYRLHERPIRKMGCGI